VIGLGSGSRIAQDTDGIAGKHARSESCSVLTGVTTLLRRAAATLLRGITAFTATGAIHGTAASATGAGWWLHLPVLGSRAPVDAVE
jgi:hypothetical protein